jgi:hypothetical protein
VQTDPHPNEPLHERFMRRARRACGARGGRECDEERVALRVDFDAAGCCEGAAEECAVLLERGCIPFGPERVQEPGRALDIREQKRDRASWKVGSGHV